LRQYAERPKGLSRLTARERALRPIVFVALTAVLVLAFGALMLASRSGG
jgi:hypothetical protein